MLHTPFIFFLIHYCTHSLSSLRIFVHHCTFCASLHVKTSPACQSVCQSVSQSVCLSVCMSVCLSVGFYYVRYLGRRCDLFRRESELNFRFSAMELFSGLQQNPGSRPP